MIRIGAIVPVFVNSLWGFLVIFGLGVFVFADGNVFFGEPGGFGTPTPRLVKYLLVLVPLISYTIFCVFTLVIAATFPKRGLWAAQYLTVTYAIYGGLFALAMTSAFRAPLFFLLCGGSCLLNGIGLYCLHKS